MPIKIAVLVRFADVATITYSGKGWPSKPLPAKNKNVDGIEYFDNNWGQKKTRKGFKRFLYWAWHENQMLSGDKSNTLLKNFQGKLVFMSHQYWNSAHRFSDALIASQTQFPIWQIGGAWLNVKKLWGKCAQGLRGLFSKSHNSVNRRVDLRMGTFSLESFSNIQNALP